MMCAVGRDWRNGGGTLVEAFLVTGAMEGFGTILLGNILCVWFGGDDGIGRDLNVVKARCEGWL